MARRKINPMEQELLKHLEYLTGIRPFRNWQNLESLKIAADYIEAEFKAYGLSIHHQKWNYGKFEYTNIVASYLPEKEKRLIVGAHYDVYSNQPGADDNTSGVAGLLALAKAVAKAQPHLPYGIDFIGYSLEEPPHFGTKNMGSYVHAESLSKTNSKVVGMICLDMIGYFSDEPDSQNYPVPELKQRFPTVGNYIAVVGRNDHAEFSREIYERMQAKGGIPIELINFPSSAGLGGLSDHRNYWHFGYDAVMINDTAKFRNPNYHEITDTVETLDLPKMTAVVEAVLHAISSPLTERPQLKPEREEPTSPENPEHPLAPKNDRIGFFKRLIAWFRKAFGK